MFVNISDRKIGQITSVATKSLIEETDYSSHFLTWEEQKVRVEGRKEGGELTAREKRSVVVVVCPGLTLLPRWNFLPPFLRAWV